MSTDNQQLRKKLKESQHALREEKSKNKSLEKRLATSKKKYENLKEEESKKTHHTKMDL